MAWAAPRTWVTGELVTAAMLNQDVRDNLLAVGNHKRIVKQLDETLTSNATMQDDDELIFPVLANEDWIVDIGLYYTAAATPDIQFGIFAPAGSTGFQGAVYFTGSTLEMTAVKQSLNTPFFAPGNSPKDHARLSAGVMVQGTAGNIRLQWAQNSSDAGATTVEAGSWLVAHRAN